MLRLNLTSSLTLTLHVLLGQRKIRFLIPHEVSRPLYVSNRSHNPFRHRDAVAHKCLSQYQLRYQQYSSCILYQPDFELDGEYLDCRGNKETFGPWCFSVFLQRIRLATSPQFLILQSISSHFWI